MASNEFKDLFSNAAQNYAKFRPHYPKELYTYLVGLSPSRSKAWDVATGNGQAAVELAKSFEKVIATDPSEQQLSEAEKLPNIHYSKTTAEQSGIENESVDLITVAQALHWFHHDQFFKEVKRVAKPQAILATWCYGLAHITPAIDHIIYYYCYEVVGKYWEPERNYIETEYKTISFPFTEMKAPPFQMQAEWSLEHLLGYLQTWSAAQKAERELGEDPLKGVQNKFEEAWGSQKKRLVTWPIALRIFRVK